ncbi:MAG: hypothetical protein FWE05_11900 [Defluviitaleaceae bacterium]|nr:hypothetical protein [Defluviitaleaceae bacterium]
MKNHERVPLGVLEINNVSKEIYPMNDYFLNYLFNNPESWEALRIIINILINKYKSFVPETRVKSVEGEIKVTTQYGFYTKITDKPKRQDLKVDSTDGLTFVEVQNKASSKPPIELRAKEYFGLSLGHM